MALSCHTFSIYQCALRVDELEVRGIVTSCRPAEVRQLVDAELLGPNDYVARSGLELQERPCSVICRELWCAKKESRSTRRSVSPLSAELSAHG